MATIESTQFNTRECAPTVVWLQGEYDIANAAELAERISSAASGSDADIVLDTRNVEFMGLAALDVIRCCHDGLAGKGRTLRVSRPSESVRRIVALCGLSESLGVPAEDASQSPRAVT